MRGEGQGVEGDNEDEVEGDNEGEVEGDSQGEPSEEPELTAGAMLHKCFECWQWV